MRSKAYPLGLPNAHESMRRKIDEGNLHASFTATLAREFVALQLPLWIENPHGSYLWDTPAWQEVLGEKWREACWVLDFCAFGAV